jgi:hypothetical protein
MGVPTSEVGYTSATAGRGDHEVHKGHVVVLETTTTTPVACGINTTTLSPLPRKPESPYTVDGYCVLV